MASKLRRIRKYKWLKRLKTHWFRERMGKRTGRKILSNRRKKWRKQLTPQRA